MSVCLRFYPTKLDYDPVFKDEAITLGNRHSVEREKYQFFESGSALEMRIPVLDTASTKYQK